MARIAILEGKVARVPFLEKEVTRIPLLEKIIEEKDKEIKILKDRLNLNSTNSHTPPSKDTIKIKAAKQREKGGKKGGQFNHVGSTLRKSEFVDDVKTHIPETCVCGANLDSVKEILVDTRQEFEIELKHVVIEHQRYSKTCPCCQIVNKEPYPVHIKSETQYGSNLKAFATLLNVDCKVPFEKVADVINDIFKLNISKGSVCNFVQKSYKGLEGFENEIKQALLDSEVVHADETGITIDVKLHWMHVLSSKDYTYLRIHPKRGSESFDQVINKYGGNLIHDFFKSYFGLTNSKHYPCGCHITRELVNLIDDKSEWAKEFIELYYELYHDEVKYNVSIKEEIYRRYRDIIEKGKKEEPEPFRRGKRGQLKKSKGLNLLLRLEAHMDAVLAFAFDATIPFTNNQAERDLRHIKSKLKISGCFRSFKGATYYARIMSAISTLKKQSCDVYQSFVTLFTYDNLSLGAE